MHTYRIKYFREHYVLSNGQVLGVYKKRIEVRYPYEPKENYTIWNVGVVIAKTRRQCNDWYMKRDNKRKRKIRYKSTGKVGLEGLNIAFSSIKSLVEDIKDGEYIAINFADEKRKRAYKYLERLGFYLGEYDYEDCYVYYKQKSMWNFDLSEKGEILNEYNS